MKATPELLKMVADAEADGRIVASATAKTQPLQTKGLGVAGIKLTEAEFQAQVIEYAQGRGWRVAHFRKVRVQRKSGKTFWETPVAADGAGFPDLELVRDRLVKVELKVGKNVRDDNQYAWAEAYHKAGVEYYLWYPNCWPEIEEVLK